MAADSADVLTAEVLVVGAGAAGLWCAEVAARGGRDVLVLEKTPRTGTKVLASGGSRCNLTTTLEAAEAARLFGPRGERFLRHAFSVLGPRDVRARFESWGVPSVEAPLEKVFPASGNARDVRDAMERAARDVGARFVLDAAVGEVRRDGEMWEVRLLDGRRARAAALVLASGGKSYPGTGTTGDGYAWLRSLGLDVVEPVPALVPLVSSAPWARDLAGIAWQSGAVALYGDGAKPLARRARPIVFSHAGISGPGAMDVSRHVARAAGTGDLPYELRLELWPTLDRELLRAALVASATQPGAPRLDRALFAALAERGHADLELPPRRLFEAVVRQAALDGPKPGWIPRSNELSKPARHALVEALSGVRIPIDGTEGWDKAEVTSGGLDLRAVSPRSMAVNGVPALFVIGELLDVDGPIGGLSFQAAWSTAELAGRALASER